MSRITRGRDAPYWVHSAPVGIAGMPAATAPLPDLDEYHALVKRACPGQCNREFWRSHRAALDELVLAHGTAGDSIPYQPDEPTVARAVALLVVGEPTWCEACGSDISVAVASMPDVAARCIWIGSSSLDPGRLAPTPPSEKTGKPGKVDAPPSPSPSFDMADLLCRWPTEWAARLSALLGYVVPATHEALVGHHVHLVAAPFARLYGFDAMATLRRGQLAAGIDEVVHRADKPCPSCRRKMLERPDGSEHWRCAKCRHTMTMADYQRMAMADAAMRARGA